jgi:hypothetical protein
LELNPLAQKFLATSYPTCTVQVLKKYFIPKKIMNDDQKIQDTPKMNNPWHKIFSWFSLKIEHRTKINFELERMKWNKILHSVNSKYPLDTK